MNRFQRYVFGQVLAAVSMSVGLFVFVMMTGTLIKEVLPSLSEGKISWSQFFELLLLAMPSVLPYALPIGILTGVLIVLGRMSAQNEILAMKSSGLSLWRITAPVFLLAVLGVLLSIGTNFFVAPRAVDTLRRIVATAVRNNPSKLIAPGEFFSDSKSDYTIYAESHDGEAMKNLRVWQFNENKQVFRVIQSESATLHFDSENEVIKLDARKSRVEEFGRKPNEGFTEPVRLLYWESMPIQLPFDALVKGLGVHKKKLRGCTLSELLTLREEGRNPRENGPPADQKEFFANRIAAQHHIQYNLASAFGILSLTLLAIPLGIKTSRSETLSNAAIALALSLTFYVLTVSVSWIRDPAWRPDLLVWLPNLLYQTIGGILLWRTAKT